MSELCARHGISRQAGYNTLARYQQGGWEGMEERRRAPRRHPNQTAAEIEQQIVELRHQHMRWGPRKLKAVLQRQQPDRRWPAVSTMGELLRREGLVIARKKRRRTDPYTAPFATADAPNRVWCGDFKGWGRTQDGAPFASRAIAGLSRLAVWWMKLGIVPERIQAAHPEQNGRHERMHLTLQQETMSPLAANRRAQQRRFEQFRREFNEQRPHEALDMHTPASCYAPSPRPYPARVSEPEYGSSMIVRRVSPGGQFMWKTHDVFFSETLRGERIALQSLDERWYTIYFAEFALGHFDSRTRTVHRRMPAHGFDRADAGEGEPTPSPAPHPQNPDQNLSTMSPV